jgi:hypothetical protein
VFDHPIRTRCCRNIGRAVGGAVVDDDDARDASLKGMVRPSSAETMDRRSDGRGFVEGWDDERHRTWSFGHRSTLLL